jgi:L-threonylcarbamoyladenylate synthase
MTTISTNILDAVKLLKEGKIIAMPTETVYGLAGNIYNDHAIKSIFELKKRPHFNPLIVHIKSVAELILIAREIPDKAKLLAAAFWPGPLTLVLPKQLGISDLITAGKDTVAIRVPNHAVALELLELLDFPLAAPSANPFGSISSTKAEHVANFFGPSLPIVLEGGACEKGIESTIVGFEGGQAVLYRLGSISIEALEGVVGPIKITIHNDATPVAPGMLSKHYSPKTPLFLSEDIAESIQKFADQRIGVLAYNQFWSSPSIKGQEVLSLSGNLYEAASRLYSAMHDLDAMQLDVIIAQRVPNHGIGIAINDKLQRAATK